MYPVSAAYKTASRAQIREAQAHARIYMGVFDATASPDAALLFPAKTKYSTPAKVNAGESIATSYATFEPDRLRLDGVHRLLPDNATEYAAQGYIGSAQSGADGSFAAPPEIVITFGVTHTLVGLTLTFDPADPPPAQMTLLAYAGATLALTATTAPAATTLQWELLLADVDKLVLLFDKTAHPQGRARLNHIEFGIGYSFQDREILALTEEHTDAPVSTTLPSAKLSFTLSNADERFTSSGDTALVRFLAAGQQVSVTYGMEVTGGTEHIPGGIWYLDSWDVDGINAKFTCIDQIARLTKTTYEKGVYDWNTHWLSDMAAAVLTDAGITDYYIDPYLATQYTSAPLPIVSHAAALQLIANRGQARIFVDRAGRVSLQTIVPNPEYRLSPPSSTTRYTYYSDIYSVLNNTGCNYATFEADYMRLDGSMQLLPEGDATVPDSGMTSKELSAEDGSFSSAGWLIWYALAVTPTNAYSVTLGFGGQLPKLISIQAYIDRKWTAAKYFTPTKLKETFYTYWEHASALQVSVLSMPQGGQRGHLSGFAVQNYTDFVLDATRIFDRSKDKLLTRLRNVTAQWIWRSYYSTVDIEVASTKVMTNSGWIRIEHDRCYGPVATVDNAAVTVEQRNYAYVSYVRLTSAAAVEVNLTITGKKLYEAAYPLTSAGYDTGEDLPVDTALYDNKNIQATLDWMRDYYMRRQETTAELPGFPELDCGDIITMDDGGTAQIISTKLTYNGAFRETLTLRR